MIINRSKRCGKQHKPNLIPLDDHLRHHHYHTHRDLHDMHCVHEMKIMIFFIIVILVNFLFFLVIFIEKKQAIKLGLFPYSTSHWLHLFVFSSVCFQMWLLFSCVCFKCDLQQIICSSSSSRSSGPQARSPFPYSTSHPTSGLVRGAV